MEIHQDLIDPIPAASQRCKIKRRGVAGVFSGSELSTSPLVR
jgi:hypothetical protein